MKKVVSKLNIHFFTLTLFVLCFLSGILAALFTDKLYIYDEFIVYTISQQPLAQLFDTLVAEPHPPGFYLLLKLLPLATPPQLIRVFISSISHLILLVAILFNFKHKILAHFKAEYGFLLLFSSVSMAQILNTVKQDALSIPLLLLLVIFILHRLKQQKTSLGFIPLLTLLSIALFGYITFAIGLTFTLGFYSWQFFRKKLTKEPFVFAALLAVIISVYVVLFGGQQYLANQHRFAWAEDYRSSIVYNLSLFLTFLDPSSFITDLSMGMFLFLCILSMVAVEKKIIPQNWLYLSVTFMAGYLILSYAANLLVRTRYMIPLYIFACALAGWGVLFLEKKLRFKVGVIIVLFFFVISRSFYLLNYFHEIRWELESITAIESQLAQHPDTTFGLLSQSSYAHYTMKLKFFADNPAVMAIHPLFPGILSDSHTIEKKHLLLDGYILGLDDQELLNNNLQQTGLHHFLFMQNASLPGTYFDEKRNLFTVLSLHCTTEIQHPYLFIFRNCWQ